jgi:hypothetical protein
MSDIEKILDKRFPTKGFCSDYTQVTIKRINAFEVFGHHEDWSSYYQISWDDKKVEAEKLSEAIKKMEEELENVHG